MPKNAISVKFFFFINECPNAFSEFSGKSMNDLISVAVELMLLGMGTVFVFLVLLIGATRLMSVVLIGMASNEKPEEELVPAPVVIDTTSVQAPRLLKAIGDAIKQHRGQA